MALAYQPIDADLTAIAALSPSNDDVLQRKAGAWTNRTMAQLATDLGVPTLSGTNTWTAQNTFAAGTITTSQPFTVTQTWNAGAVAFTGLYVSVTSTASAAASLVQDYQVGGTSIWSTRKDGAVGRFQAGGAVLVPLAQSGNSGFGVGLANNAEQRISLGPAGVGLNSALVLWWTTSALDGNGTKDTGLSRNAAGVVEINNGTAGTYRDIIARAANIGAAEAAASSGTHKTKAIASIADNTATATFTITVPNASHSASIQVTFAGKLGAGGAVGAGEATGTISYDIAIARTAGVNAVAGISAAYGSATAAVAGAATITVSAAMSAVTGAVGASNTFTVNVTIARGSGASANHTCLAYARLMNANATGITIA